MVGEWPFAQVLVDDARQVEAEPALDKREECYDGKILADEIVKCIQIGADGGRNGNPVAIKAGSLLIDFVLANGIDERGDELRRSFLDGAKADGLFVFSSDGLRRQANRGAVGIVEWLGDRIKDRDPSVIQDR